MLQHDCFFPPNWCYAHLLGTVAVAMTVTHHHGHVASPTLAHEFPARPAGSASQRFAHIPRDSASLSLRGTVPMCSTGPALSRIKFSHGLEAVPVTGPAHGAGGGTVTELPGTGSSNLSVTCQCQWHCGMNLTVSRGLTGLGPAMAASNGLGRYHGLS